MISLVCALAKQNLIAQKNNLQMQMLNNSAYQRSMISNPYFCGNLEYANAIGTSLELENIDNSVQLMAINAELEALNNYAKKQQGSKIDFHA